MNKWIFNHQVLVIAILCLVSRLPQLLSASLILDGDECIEGIMAKHFIEGKEIPYLFYGQAYGFSFIEVVIIGIYYTIAGISDIAIKLAMLSLWTVGIIFFYKTAKQLSPHGKWSLFLITLVFIFSPAWVIWSMKARGGYLTSFALSSILTYLIFNERLNKYLIVSILSGFLTVLIYQSQPLWLAGLIPLLGYYLYKIKVKHSLFYISGILTAAILFYFLKVNISNFWSPLVLSFSNINMNTLFAVPLHVYQNITGSYYYNDIITPALIIKFWAFTFTLLIFLTLGFGFFSLFKIEKFNPFFHLFCLSVLFTVGYLVVMNGESPRYLLPLSGFALLMFYMLVVNVKNRVIPNTILLLFIISGIVTTFNFGYDKYEKSVKSELLHLTETLESQNIRYIYCENGLLQWEIMFYSKEKIIARYRTALDRYPEYIQKTDDALNNAPSTVALVGIFYPEIIHLIPGVIVVDERYFICKNPGKNTLTEHGFELKSISTR